MPAEGLHVYSYMQYLATHDMYIILKVHYINIYSHKRDLILFYSLQDS